jgi:hypothetical protein
MSLFRLSNPLFMFHPSPIESAGPTPYIHTTEQDVYLKYETTDALILL